MATISRSSTEDMLVAAAQRGDDASFAELIGPLRAPIHAHCYRMLGSVQDADDALQESLLRAWRGLPAFTPGGPLRAWLYRIATNVCLDAIAKRPRRRAPAGEGPAARPTDEAGTPLPEGAWVEPIADRDLADAHDDASPETRYEQREAVELAFLAALQHLPGNQRAALLLRDVLGFSAAEAAKMLGTTRASINSSVQRARARLDERLPAVSQSRTLAALGETATKQLAADYAEALERGDIERLAALLTEDVTFSMPPFPAWWRGRETIVGFAASDRARRRVVPIGINGQLGFSGYRWERAAGAFIPELVEVVEIAGTRVSSITVFCDPAGCEPAERPQIARLFERLGLPPTR
jgi:RNA polymerase sigma-70 factor (ECF subfamily)